MTIDAKSVSNRIQINAKVHQTVVQQQIGAKKIRKIMNNLVFLKREGFSSLHCASLPEEWSWRNQPHSTTQQGVRLRSAPFWRGVYIRMAPIVGRGV